MKQPIEITRVVGGRGQGWEKGERDVGEGQEVRGKWREDRRGWRPRGRRGGDCTLIW